MGDYRFESYDGAPDLGVRATKLVAMSPELDRAIAGIRESG